MEYLVMECGLSYAVVLDQDGRILKVPNLGYTVGQSLKDVVLLPERPVRQQVLHKRIARWSALAACLCLLLLGSHLIFKKGIGNGNRSESANSGSNNNSANCYSKYFR